MLFLSSIPIYFAATIALVNGDPRILPLSEFRAGVFSVIENVEVPYSKVKIMFQSSKIPGWSKIVFGL